MSDQLTLFAGDSPANRSARQAGGVGSPQTCGQNLQGWSVIYDRGSLLRRMFKNCQFAELPPFSALSATLPLNETLTQLQQGRQLREVAGGPLHTPTTKANFTAHSMQKWPSCRRYVKIFGAGRILPEQFEFLMGYPIGWTALDPSETPSSRKSSKS